MKSLAEIKAVADSLSREQQFELFLFLAARLRPGSGQLPPPRVFTREQIEGWITQDEEGLRCFNANK